MTDLFRSLFFAQFLAHGYCMRWQRDIVWLHAVSDVLIACAYLCIPALLQHFVRKRRDVPFHWLFWGFSLFIVSCGLTHAVDAVTLWYPLYRLSGWLKAITAAASVGTAIILVRLMPRLLLIPSNKQMREANLALEAEVEQRRKAEAALAAAYREMEQTVERRTRDLAMANSALTRSESRFRATFDQAGIGLAQVSPDGRFTKVNSQLCRIVGLAPEELLETSFADITHPDDLEADWSQARQLLDGTLHQYQMEKRYIRPGGEIVWVTLTASLVWTDSQPEYFIAAVADITPRKLAEEKLLQSEMRYREQAAALLERDRQLALVFDKGGIGDWTWDIGSDLVQAHDTVWMLYGEPGRRGSGPATWFRERQFPEDTPIIEQAVRTMFESSGSLDMEFRVIWPDGSIHWLTARAAVVYDTPGNPIQVRGVNFETTARKEAEIRLRESEQHLRTLANALPQLVWTARPDGYLDSYNDQWYEFTGFARGAGGDESWRPILHPDDVQHCLDCWYSSVRSGQPYEIEYRFWDRHRQEFRWHLGRARPLFSEGGQIVRWFGTCTDIHEQKTAKERLEAEVLSRTAELSRSLLEKETLLQEVHHRVKNNLQVISSLLKMQGESLKDRTAASALKESQQRVLSMALIHERLYGSREMDQIEFGEYTDTLVGELFFSYADRTGPVTRNVKASRVFLNIDQAIPCGLILNELVTNALKYAYPDGRTGEVVVELRQTPSERVILTVSDTGIGLPENLNWKGSKSLGLPIVEILAKQLGGSLRVERSAGTAFIVEFPRKSKKAESAPAA